MKPADVIIELQTIFPNMVIPDAERMVNTWERYLSDFSSQTLTRALRDWVDNNAKFPPNLAEFRAICQKVDQPKEPDTLRATAYELEELALAGEYDPAEWESLAVLFDKTDRPHAAADLRKKAIAYEKIARTQ